MGKQSHLEQALEKISLGHSCKDCLIYSCHKTHTDRGVVSRWIVDICRQFPSKNEHFNCADCPHAQDFCFGGLEKREKKLML